MPANITMLFCDENGKNRLGMLGTSRRKQVRAASDAFVLFWRDELTFAGF